MSDTVERDAYGPNNLRPAVAGISGPIKHRLFLRFLSINAAGAALLGAAWLHGWIDPIIAGDSTGLTSLIAAVFLAGLILCGKKVWRVSTELDRLTWSEPPNSSWVGAYRVQVKGAGGATRQIAAAGLRLGMASYISPIRHIANSLVLLGLIGTVVGFIIALSGVDPDTVSDVSAISPMVSTLLSGMAVALYTTLVGAALSLWLTVNHHLLSAETAQFTIKLTAAGEVDAGP
jgi:hypothetical protein